MMRRSRAALIATAIATGAMALAACAAPALRYAAPAAARPRAPGAESFRIVVVGDTQQMPPFDWFVRGGPAERGRVREKIESLKPDLVLHAGDVVGFGSSASEWADFRREFASLPIWPVLGNHDLAGSNEEALANYFAAFPHVEGRRWYALRHPPLAILMLDSNLGDLSDEEEAAQRAWLVGELDRAEADPAIRGIVLVTHHPPLSTQIGGGSARVREAFFDEAAKRSKFTAFLSGHHHAYQHIEMGGRHAFVTGGGGAPLLLWKCGALPEGARLVHARTAHHVLELRVGPDGMQALMHELSPNPGRWSVGEESFVRWPARSAGPLGGATRPARAAGPGAERGAARRRDPHRRAPGVTDRGRSRDHFAHQCTAATCADRAGGMAPAASHNHNDLRT